MIYFSTKENIKFMGEFRTLFETFRQIEIKGESNVAKISRTDLYVDKRQLIQKISSNVDADYPIKRANYAKNIPRAIQITEEAKINHIFMMQTSQFEGNKKYIGSFYNAILDRPTAFQDFDTDVRDTIDQVLGVLEQRQKNELWSLFNPFYWLKELINLVFRFPKKVLEMSGFSQEVIEQHFIAKMFQLIFILLSLYILGNWFNISVSDTIQIIKP